MAELSGVADNQGTMPHISGMAEQAYRKNVAVRAALNSLSHPRTVRGWKADPLLTPRPFGTMRGEIWLAPDFDDTPEDLIAFMENGIEPASSE